MLHINTLTYFLILIYLLFSNTVLFFYFSVFIYFFILQNAIDKNDYGHFPFGPICHFYHCTIYGIFIANRFEIFSKYASVHFPSTYFSTYTVLSFICFLYSFYVLILFYVLFFIFVKVLIESY